MLSSVSMHLQKNGKFVFDVFMPDPLALYRHKSLKINLMEYRCKSSGKIINVKESVNYNYKNNIIYIRWYYYQEKSIINQIKFKILFIYYCCTGWPPLVQPNLNYDLQFQDNPQW